MGNQESVKNFIHVIAALETEFEKIAKKEVSDISIIPEKAVVAYNAFDYANTQISYHRKRFQKGTHYFFFEYNSIDATNDDTKILILSDYGVAENVMLTADIIYNPKERQWYVWEPIDIDKVYNLQEQPISKLKKLAPEMIKQIVHTFFDEDE